MYEPDNRHLREGRGEASRSCCQPVISSGCSVDSAEVSFIRAYQKEHCSVEMRLSRLFHLHHYPLLRFSQSSTVSARMSCQSSSSLILVGYPIKTFDQSLTLENDVLSSNNRCHCGYFHVKLWTWKRGKHSNDTKWWNKMISAKPVKAVSWMAQSGTSQHFQSISCCSSHAPSKNQTSNRRPIMKEILKHQEFKKKKAKKSKREKNKQVFGLSDLQQTPVER